MQVVPASGFRFLQPPPGRDARLRDLPVDGKGPLADRREYVEEPSPDQFVAATSEDGGGFLVQFGEAVIDGISCVVQDHFVERVTLEHLLKEEAVLLLAPSKALVGPHPLDDPPEPCRDGIDQGAFFEKERSLVLRRFFVKIADLHLSRDPAAYDDRALLLPAGLHEPGRAILPAVERDPGGSILRVEPAGGEDGDDLCEDLVDRYAGPFNDVVHGIEGRKLSHPAIKSDLLLPERLFCLPPVHNV